MISEVEALEERIAEQDRTIIYLGNYTDKLVSQRNEVIGLLREYDCGRMTAKMLVSELRLYVRQNGN